MNPYLFKVACLNDEELAIKNHKGQDMATLEIGFAYACGEGYLKLAKKLFKTYKKLNINNHNDCAFRLACRNGHIDVAKWLYSKHHNFDISYDKDFPFRYSCRNNHIDLAVWLFCLSDRYVLHVKDNKITYFWCYEYAEEN